MKLKVQMLQQKDRNEKMVKLHQSSKSPKAILKVDQTHLGRKGRHLSKPKLSGKSSKTIGTKCKVHHGTQRSSKSKIGSQNKVKNQQIGMPTKQQSLCKWNDNNRKRADALSSDDDIPLSVIKRGMPLSDPDYDSDDNDKPTVKEVDSSDSEGSYCLS